MCELFLNLALGKIPFTYFHLPTVSKAPCCSCKLWSWFTCVDKPCPYIQRVILMFGSVLIVYITGPVQTESQKSIATPPSSVENTSLNVQTSAGKREYDRCWCTGCRLIVCTAAAESRSLQMQIGWILTEGRDSTQPSFAMQCLPAIYPSNHSHRQALFDQWSVLFTEYMLHRWGSVFNVVSVLFYDLHIKPFHGRTFLGLFLPLRKLPIQS